MEPYSKFQRHNYDIYSTVNITYPRACLGGNIIIHTIDGDVAYNVKAGIQTGTRVCLRGGVPSLRNKKMRGNHYVDLVVDVPTSLSKDQKKLLEQLDETFEKKTRRKKIKAIAKRRPYAGAFFVFMKGSINNIKFLYKISI